MTRKLTVPHEEAIILLLRKDRRFAVEYLKSALEDNDEPRVLLIALRHIAQARGIAKVAKAAGIEREPVSGPVGPWESPALHARCSH